MLKRIIAILSLILSSLLYTCTPGRQTRSLSLQSGDLLFVVAGGSQMEQAITEATARHDSLQFSHCAILLIQGKDTSALEASAERGVWLCPWQDFLAQVPKRDGRPAIVVKRLTGYQDIEVALARALSHLGENYDWHYRHGNGEMYCSELLHDAYRDSVGRPVFPAVPMNFQNAEGEYPAFWTELFERLEDTIPQGEPGTNPNALARNPQLEEVLRLF